MELETRLQVAKRRGAQFRGVLLLGVLLAACNMTGDVPAGSQAEHGNDETTKAGVALTLGPVESRIFDELDSYVDVEQYDGSQDVSDYGLLIFDGDAHEPEVIQDHDVILKALRAGKWILGLDLSPAHQKEGLGSRIGFATSDASSAYMVHAGLGEHGRTVYRIIGDAPLESFSANPPGDGTAAEAKLEQSGAAAYARVVAKVLKDGDTLASQPTPAGGLQVQDAAPSPDTPIPAELIHQQWIYSFVGDGARTGSGKASGTQNFSFLVNYTFTVFLNNNRNPQGDFQYVLVQIDGQANPTYGTGNFVRMAKDEKAWFQDRVVLEFSPVDSSNFQWVANDPQTPNGETTYTADSGFDVGFEGKSAGASYHHSSSQEYHVSDWAVFSNSAGKNMKWEFRSTNPDSNQGYDTCAWRDCGAFGSSYPKDPNALSKGQLQFHASVVYRTYSLLDGWTAFNRGGYLNLVDIYCANDFGAVCTNPGAWETRPAYINGGPFSINMGAVVPIPIENITFSQNPAFAGSPVTGTITLEKPAQVDTLIQLSSNSKNATVKPSVTIPHGDTSASFQVLTNANNLSTGASTTATITAFYAGDFQTQLTVKNAGPNDIAPPTTAPRIDPTRYAQCAGNTGKWAPGYEVRYAASFVAANGTETDRGPWTSWTNGTPYMLPNLQDIPTDPSGKAVARKVYRQFKADYNPSNPSAGITLTGTLNNNTTTELQDEDTAGTPVVPCPS